MGFFTKTREKGLKPASKDKKKTAAAVAAVLVTSAATLKTTQDINKKPISPTTTYATNIIQDKEEQDKKRQKSEVQQTFSISSSNTVSSSSLPWWVGDLSFVVEGKKITAHKVVISSKSKGLALLIEQNPSGVIQINDFSHQIFSQLIKWIYGGRFDISAEESEELRMCATVYDVPDLVDACIAVKKPELDFQPVVMAPIMTELANNQLQQQQQQFQQQQQISTDFNLDIPDIIDDFITSPTLDSNTNFEFPSHNIDQGMSIWSDDPILYNPEPQDVDAYRLMEIY